MRDTLSMVATLGGLVLLATGGAMLLPGLAGDREYLYAGLVVTALAVFVLYDGVQVVGSYLAS